MPDQTSTILSRIGDLGYDVEVEANANGVVMVAIHRETGEQFVARAAINEWYEAACELARGSRRCSQRCPSDSRLASLGSLLPRQGKGAWARVGITCDFLWCELPTQGEADVPP